MTAFAASTSFSFGQNRWHIKPTEQEIQIRQNNPKPFPLSQSARKPTASTFVMPSDARIPGEFEESQAVAIAWVYSWDGGTGFTLDVQTEYAALWAEMADAIQKEVPVWIRVEDGADTTPIKSYMASKGTPLTNYRFDVMVGDDFWIRDFGPIGFYYGQDDKVGFVDLKYYPGRDLDNLYPQMLADNLGYLNVHTNLYAEGGNFITDGFYKSFHSDVVDDVNMNPTNWHTAHGPWTAQQVKDSVNYIWASKESVSTPTLLCDGGTGHNDMFMKLMDENTFAVMEYPTVITAQDKGIIDGVINSLTGMKSAYGRPYRIYKVPMPTQDDGSYSLVSCSDINNDARTFINGTTVNSTYLMPTYSSATSGNKQGDLQAIEAFKKIAPGYKIVPLDARILTVLGGAIHCVNMQIPAENPITIWHPPVQDLQPRKSSYHIVVKPTNKSGIAATKCMWRVKGSQNWNTVDLADSAGYKIGDIKGSFKLMSDNTIIEYYISATSNNGKTITKPIVANTGGYYSFYFSGTAVGTEELDPTRNFAMNPIPNPTTGAFSIPVSFDRQMEVSAHITDVLGKRISTIDFGRKDNGMNRLEFDLANQAAGMYFIQITANGQLLDTKRIMKQ